jgi:hypothetical protein
MRTAKLPYTNLAAFLAVSDENSFIKKFFLTPKTILAAAKYCIFKK